MGYKTYTCPHTRDCGGCEWLAVPYPIQLQRKHDALAELFKDFDIEVEPVIGMEEPQAYRAKVMTPFQPGPKGTLLHGMYKQGSHELVPCDSCLVEYPHARPILGTIARLARDFRIKAYDEDAGTGLLRHAVVRCAYASRDVMVTIVANSKEFPHKKEFVRALREEHPEISSVAFNVNTRDTNAVLGNRTSVAFGQDWLEDELCDCTFRIPATAFYQTNPEQTEVLYRTAVGLAGLQGGETVLDAYCGIGTIGIVAADTVRKMPPPSPKNKKKAKTKKAAQPPKRQPIHVIGVESVAAAADIASENARINKLSHMEFVAGDAGEFMRRCIAELDVVFMDPPRGGASQEFIDALLVSEPERIVYVSCNPETQVRDIQTLAGTYAVQRLVPVDMFPHTKHVETVALLTKKH